MNYIEVKIAVSHSEEKEILIALLSEKEYESFSEEDNTLLAYIQEVNFDEKHLNELQTVLPFSYGIKTIQQQNWNAQWEAGFEPVTVPGFCTVRAHFHPKNHSSPYDIIITPKMSFGTGHHATTMLMMQEMQHIDFESKKVLDFGTGTGILAILAEKLGANNVLAIDNDDWSVENTIENIQLNSSGNIDVKKGSLEVVTENRFDIILANINRNILTYYMQDISNLLKADGILLLSGILIEDVYELKKSAEANGLSHQKESTLNGWATMLFRIIAQ